MMITVAPKTQHLARSVGSRVRAEIGLGSSDTTVPVTGRRAAAEPRLGVTGDSRSERSVTGPGPGWHCIRRYPVTVTNLRVRTVLSSAYAACATA